MNRLRLLAVGIAATAGLALSAPLAVAAPDTAAAETAVGYLVSKLTDGDHLTSDFGNESMTADGLLALVAAGRAEDAATIEAMTAYLEKQAPNYATTAPESAAKLAVVAAATGRQATAFGGQDLIALTKAGVKEDGTFGAYPGPYASGLAMIALSRAGEEIPQPLVDALLSAAAGDGGWGYDPSQPSDADSTGMALLGLAAVPQPTEAVTDAIAAATTWAATARTADGSWPGFAPVNSTAVLGSALQATGSDQPEAVAYLATQQQADGGLATGADGASGSDPLATAQGVLLLAGTDYLHVGATPAATSGPGWDATTAALWIGIVALGVGVGVAAVVVRRKPR